MRSTDLCRPDKYHVDLRLDPSPGHALRRLPEEHQVSRPAARLGGPHPSAAGISAGPEGRVRPTMPRRRSPRPPPAQRRLQDSRSRPLPTDPRERDRCSTTQDTSRRKRTLLGPAPRRRSAERRGGTARFAIELARAQRLGPRVRPTRPSVRLLGPRAAPTTTLQGTLDARDDDPRTPDLAHSEHAFFGSESTPDERRWRGEPSARPTGVGCRVSGALGSGCASRSNLSPSFVHTEHPSVTAGRASGLETPLALPTT